MDGSVHRTWKVDLMEQSNSLLVFLGIFEKEIRHTNLGVIRRNTISYEYYWLDRWYNVFLFLEPNGDFRNYYCNINKPPTFENNTLDYIDLDLDILIWKDFQYTILDEDEFAENSLKYNYSDELVKQAYANLNVLELMIKSREFPFNENTTI